VTELLPFQVPPNSTKMLMKNRFINFYDMLSILFDGMFCVMTESIPSFRRHI